MQLYLQIREDIVTGAYEYNAKLPSKRLMAEESGVSVITVEHAYSILCDEGYIKAKERSGYFVIYRAADFITAGAAPIPSRRRDSTLGVAVAGREDFPFSVLARTMRRVLLDYGEALLARSPNAGCDELRRAICAYLRRSVGIGATAEQIVIGSGAEYLYSLIALLLGPDRVFATEDPCYSKIRRVYAANGVRCEALPLREDGIDSAALWSSEASVLHVTPFNSYPTGITASASKRREYLRFAKERGGYIIEDNYDSELTVSKKNEDTLYSLSDEGSVIYLNTFSHTISPSMRVGYMVLSPELSRKFAEKLGFYSCTVPVFEQIVLAELLDNGDFERHVNRVRRKKRRLAGK